MDLQHPPIVSAMRYFLEVTNMKQNDFQKVANQVSFVTIVVNILLAFMKLLAGVFAHSNAMISDSIHSASDVFSTMIVVIGIKLSSKQPDKEHPYGHERMECVAAIVLSMVLFMTGLGIGVEALTDVLKGEYSHLQVPGMLALAAAVISIVSKEAMYWYTRYYAKKIDSSALMADAWHHRSDAFSSIGALVGIVGARMGFPVMDPIASLVIFVFIVKAAYEIFKDAMDKWSIIPVMRRPKNSCAPAFFRIQMWRGLTCFRRGSLAIKFMRTLRLR